MDAATGLSGSNPPILTDDPVVKTGELIPYMGLTAKTKTGYVDCAGGARDKLFKDYMALWEAMGEYSGDTTDLGTSLGNATADNLTNSFTLVGHGLSDDDVIYLRVKADGPTEVAAAANKLWYVVNSTTDTFQISQTEGGAAFAFTDDGVANQAVYKEFGFPNLTGIYTGLRFFLKT